MIVPNIVQYFADTSYTESLVIAFVYPLPAQAVTLVCDYADNVIQAVLEGRKPSRIAEGKPYHRDVHRLVFLGVTDYARTIGSSLTASRLEPYKNRFLAKDHVPSISIDTLDVHPGKSSAAFAVSLAFVNFGGCSSLFIHLRVERKLLRSTGKNAEGEWVYIDVSTNQPVDFYHPFDLHR